MMSNMGGGYSTLGRPNTLSLSKQAYQRSSSNPDLAITPTSPDAEMAGFFGETSFMIKLYFKHFR